MERMIGHGDGFLKPFRLIVNASRANGIDVAPVILGLRVNQRVPIDLGRGGDQDTGFLDLGQSQAIMGAQGTHFECLNGYFQIGRAHV